MGHLSNYLHYRWTKIRRERPVYISGHQEDQVSFGSVITGSNNFSVDTPPIY